MPVVWKKLAYEEDVEAYIDAAISPYAKLIQILDTSYSPILDSDGLPMEDV
jgi:hypothetical protein